MSAREKAKKLFDSAVSSGKGTDYFWSDDFYVWCKEKAVYKAKQEYCNSCDLNDIITEINEIPI